MPLLLLVGRETQELKKCSEEMCPYRRIKQRAEERIPRLQWGDTHLFLERSEGTGGYWCT